MGEGGFDEILAKVPEGAREFSEIAKDIIESVNKAIDFFVADDEGGGEFSRYRNCGRRLGKECDVFGGAG